MLSKTRRAISRPRGSGASGASRDEASAVLTTIARRMSDVPLETPRVFDIGCCLCCIPALWKGYVPLSGDTRPEPPTCQDLLGPSAKSSKVDAWHQLFVVRFGGDADRFHHITYIDPFDDVHALYRLAEYRVLIVQVLLRGKADVELA